MLHLLIKKILFLFNVFALFAVYTIRDFIG